MQEPHLDDGRSDDSNDDGVDPEAETVSLLVWGVSEGMTLRDLVQLFPPGRATEPEQGPKLQVVAPKGLGSDEIWERALICFPPEEGEFAMEPKLMEIQQVRDVTAPERVAANRAVAAFLTAAGRCAASLHLEEATCAEPVGPSDHVPLPARVLAMLMHVEAAATLILVRTLFMDAAEVDVGGGSAGDAGADAALLSTVEQYMAATLCGAVGGIAFGTHGGILVDPDLHALLTEDGVMEEEAFLPTTPEAVHRMQASHDVLRAKGVVFPHLPALECARQARMAPVQAVVDLSRELAAQRCVAELGSERACLGASVQALAWLVGHHSVARANEPELPMPVHTALLDVQARDGDVGCAAAEEEEEGQGQGQGEDEGEPLVRHPLQGVDVTTLQLRNTMDVMDRKDLLFRCYGAVAAWARGDLKRSQIGDLDEIMVTAHLRVLRWATQYDGLPTCWFDVVAVCPIPVVDPLESVLQ